MDDNSHLRHIENIVLLRNTPLFSGLAPSQLQRIAMSLRERRYEKGQKILEKGIAITTLLIIKEGSCSSKTEHYANGTVIKAAAVFIPNYIVREDIIADEHCSIVSLDQTELYETLRNNPGTALRLIEWFASKIESI